MKSMSQPTFEQEWPGQRLGLPEHGTGSVATWGRRIAALFIDWFASLLAAAFITNVSGVDNEFLTLAVFLVEVTLFTAIAGGSFGQLALRIAVVRLDGRRLTLLDALIRTILICLVVPPVVFNRDNRGLHDLAVKTVTIRR